VFALPGDGTEMKRSGPAAPLGDEADGPGDGIEGQGLEIIPRPRASIRKGRCPLAAFGGRGWAGRRVLAAGILAGIAGWIGGCGSLGPAGRGLEASPPADSDPRPALSWTSADGRVRVLLEQSSPQVPRGDDSFRLVVSGADGWEVYYRTAINSSSRPPVRLSPLPSSAPPGTKEYEFKHHFSRMSIWMALEFRKDGKCREDLTRTFYGGLDHLEANNRYWTPGKPEEGETK